MSNYDPRIVREILFPTQCPLYYLIWNDEHKECVLQEIDNNIIYGDVLGTTRELQEESNFYQTSLFSYLGFILNDILTENKKEVVLNIINELKHELEYRH